LDYKKSKNNIYRIIDLLEKENTVFDLEKSFDKIKTKRIKNNLVFILTDKTEFDLKKIKFLNQNNDIILINIFDKFENELILDF
jgi:tRNA pseudouridine-54 N-methylase